MATFPTCFWVRFLGLWIRPALVLPRRNKKHNIPWTPPKTSCVFLFRAAVCCDTTCCENIRKHRFRPPLCEKQRSQLRLKCQTFRTEIQFCIPRELFSDLGQFAFAPQIASVRKQFPSGCKIGSRYEKSDFFRQAFWFFVGDHANVCERRDQE